MKTDNTKLDIEGIRVKHLKFQRLTDDEITDLLIEVDRLQSELKPLRKIYNAVNLMLNELGAYGEITTMHDTVSDLMDELHDFDGGVYTRIDLEQTK